MSHNFTIVGGDTDSIMFCKKDMSPFPKEEQRVLLDEINSLLPKMIKYDSDGVFSFVVYAKAKNYLMVDENGKWKLKGSAFKSATMEPILKEMMTDFLKAIVEKRMQDLPKIYEQYINMVECIKDIKPWCTKKTLSPTTYNSPRKNETDIIDAIKGTDYVSGDKVYLYVKTKEVETGEFYKVGVKKGQPKMKTVRYYCLADKFDGEYDKDTYRKKIYQTVKRFGTVMDISIFQKY